MRSYPVDEDEYPETCPRCKCCDTYIEECPECGGEGHTPEGLLYSLDPLWYDEDDVETCQLCRGKGHWWRCLGQCDENGQHTPH